MLQSRVLSRALACVLVLGLSAACGDGGSPGDPMPIPGTLALAISPASGSVQAGATGSATVSVTRGGSFSGAVALAVEGTPAGVSATLGSASLPTGTTSTALSIAVDSSTSPGTYPLTVRGTGSGVSATSTYTLTVTALPTLDPDFGVELATTTFTIQEGDSATAAVRVRRLGGFAGSVGLFVSGAPDNVQARVTPNSTTDTTASLGIAVSVGVPAGTYPLVLTASESGPRTRTVNITLIVTAKPSAGTLTLSQSSIQVVQTQPSTPIVVRLARAPGVTGPIELDFQSFSNGMTGTFTPNPASGDSATLVINTTLLSGVGTVAAIIRATVGGTTTTVPLLVTTTPFAPPNFGLTVTPNVAAVTAGNATAPLAVAISRTNLTEPVALTVTGMPLGMTATVTPSAATGNSATLNITTAPTVAPGVYPLTIQGTAVGVNGSRTTTLSLTVNAPMGGGNVQWQFCLPSRYPLWFGVRSGTDGAWTQITATNSAAGVRYTFPFDQTGQIAYVQSAADGFNTVVFNATPQEILTLAAAECEANRPGKTLNGRFINGINGLRGANIVAGGASTMVPAAGSTFTLTGVKTGLTDIIVYLGVPQTTEGLFPDRVIMRRDIDPIDGATLDDFDFDFVGSTEWLPAVGANHFFRNFGGETFAVTRSYITGNGNLGTIDFDPPRTDSIRSTIGIPQGLQRPGDLHQTVATTVNASAPRIVTSYSESFSSSPSVFGPLLATPTVVVPSTRQVQVLGTWMTEYGSAVSAAFVQAAGAPNARTVVVSGSRAALGAGASYTVLTPDFAGAPGFDTNWLLRAGVLTTWTTTATGVGAGASLTPADGTQIISGSRIGTVTP